MQVRLVALSSPAVPECKTPGDLIAYCARVSNPENQVNTTTAPRLLAYLVRNQHWSPFEMASMTLEISTTRDIARQILRHRSFSFQEFSQRYAAVVSEPVAREARLQDMRNRQDSHETSDRDLTAWWLQAQTTLSENAQSLYREALRRGMAKEVARSILPEGTTESILYMAGTIRSWIHYCQLRTANGTQKEHREVAQACQSELLKHYPELSEVLASPSAA
jgi:thymidylate synthase (FAD)